MKLTKFSTLIGLTAAFALYASPSIGQAQSDERESVSALPPVTSPRSMFYPRQWMDVCMKRQNDLSFCVDFVRRHYHEERAKDNETVSEPLLHSNSFSSSEPGCLGSEIGQCIKILNTSGKISENRTEIDNILQNLSHRDVMGNPADATSGLIGTNESV